MRLIKQIAAYASWPIAIGLIVALGSLTFFPNLVGMQAESVNPSTARPQWYPERQGITSFHDAVAKASQSVVNIYTLKQIKRPRHPFFEDPVFRRLFNLADIPRQQRMQSALGSGVIVSEKGYILTNFHVINGADEIVVATQDGRDANAIVVGENRQRDLAVLRVNLNNLDAININTHAQPRVGDIVLAIGNPFGLGQTVTQGIVSATRTRDLGLNISLFEDFIQTDAAINPGNSGGALIDIHGNLLGINTANLDNPGMVGGISFAIPIDIAMQTVNDVIEFGRVIKGWLGVEAVLLTPKSAQRLGLLRPDGILIRGVSKAGPAQKAGLTPGDVIIGINNKAIENPKKAFQHIQESRPGDVVTINVLRSGSELAIPVTLEERPQERQ